MLVACSHHSPAPVEDLYAPSQPHFQNHSVVSNSHTVRAKKRTYVVRKGDTLFSIAWYFSLDHRELAKINKLKSNTIYPGQTIKLRPDFQYQHQPVFNPRSLITALNREVLKHPVEWGSQSKITRTKQQPKRSQSKPSNKNKKPKIRSSSKRTNNKVTPKTSSQQTRVARAETKKSTSLNWIWPTEGKIIGRFSSKSNSNRGLDIAAKRGQPVRATAPGKVVYKGNGLRGYGNLVIIKHNNDYLSAYAHNDRVHVAENEFVKAGQRIADIGSSGTQGDKLHFEIRYKGRPVDPLNYLPNR